MNKKEVARQGDVLIKLAQIPADAVPTNESVIAYGEVTGHAHRFPEGRGTIYEHPATKRRFLRVIPGGLSVTHEEHENVNLPEGDYELSVQREYDWFSEEARSVAD